MYVFLFRNNHAPQGSYYLVAADRDEVMRECELASYMIYEKRISLVAVAEHLNVIPTQNGVYYESMATAFVYSRPDACKQCVNRLCGRSASDEHVRPVGAMREVSMKDRYNNLTRYPGRSGEEVSDDED
jgi:hypothetical protein